MKYLIDLDRSVCSYLELLEIIACIEECANTEIKLNYFSFSDADINDYTFLLQGTLVDLTEEDMLMLKLKFNIVTVDFTNNEVRLYPSSNNNSRWFDEYTIVK